MPKHNLPKMSKTDFPICKFFCTFTRFSTLTRLVPLPHMSTAGLPSRSGYDSRRSCELSMKRTRPSLQANQSL